MASHRPTARTDKHLGGRYHSEGGGIIGEELKGKIETLGQEESRTTEETTKLDVISGQ